jgi:hypothetical protein
MTELSSNKTPTEFLSGVLVPDVLNIIASGIIINGWKEYQYFYRVFGKYFPVFLKHAKLNFSAGEAIDIGNFSYDMLPTNRTLREITRLIHFKRFELLFVLLKKIWQCEFKHCCERLYDRKVVEYIFIDPRQYIESIIWVESNCVGKTKKKTTDFLKISGFRFNPYEFMFVLMCKAGYGEKRKTNGVCKSRSINKYVSNKNHYTHQQDVSQGITVKRFKVPLFEECEMSNVYILKLILEISFIDNKEELLNWIIDLIIQTNFNMANQIGFDTVELLFVKYGSNVMDINESIRKKFIKRLINKK